MSGGNGDRSCIFYDKQSNSWSSISGMMESRENAACAVFEGKIVVSGGFRQFHTLNSVETYDYHENKWSNFPSMLSARRNHTAVSIRNKMFMIGNSFNSWEVFDSFTRKFTSIKSMPELIFYIYPNKTVCIGYKIYFFVGEKYYSIKIHSYDVMENLFRFETSLNKEKTDSFSCTKVAMN